MKLEIRSEVLDAGLPMHLLFDAAGQVLHVGPTLEKIAPGATGRSVGDVLRIVQPRLGTDPRHLLRFRGRRLTVELRHERQTTEVADRTRMRAVVYALGEGKGLMNVFFGAGVARGVARHDLSAGDFAAYDPMVEVLFLMEAQTAVLGEFRRLNDRLTEAHREAETLSVTDKLTGLHNRRAMDAFLADLVEDPNARFALMHLDLDYFKSVNDTLGHAAGDHVLAQVGHILREQVRKGDMVARVGGDEFMLVFNGCTDLELLASIADRIIAMLEAPIPWEDHECRISGSIGITLSTFYDQLQVDRLMSDADTALYLSKNQGRAQHCVADPNSKHAAGGGPPPRHDRPSSRVAR